MKHILGRMVGLGTYVALVALSLSLAAPGSTEETLEERYDKFSFFANCEPMDLLVVSLNSDAKDIGLTEERIQAAVESRLRSARLYDSDAYNFLLVAVNVSDFSFSVIIQYMKEVTDQASGLSFPAATYHNDSVGTHGKDSGYILSTVSEHLDQFLVNFLRANEEACEKR